MTWKRHDGGTEGLEPVQHGRLVVSMQQSEPSKAAIATEACPAADRKRDAVSFPVHLLRLVESREPSSHSFQILVHSFNLAFPNTQIESFLQDLHLCGFTSIASGSSDSKKAVVTFAHDLFQRDRPELVRLMKFHGKATLKSSESSQIRDSCRQREPTNSSLRPSASAGTFATEEMLLVQRLIREEARREAMVLELISVPLVASRRLMSASLERRLQLERETQGIMMQRQLLAAVSLNPTTAPMGVASLSLRNRISLHPAVAAPPFPSSNLALELRLRQEQVQLQLTGTLIQSSSSSLGPSSSQESSSTHEAAPETTADLPVAGADDDRFRPYQDSQWMEHLEELKA